MNCNNHLPHLITVGRIFCFFTVVALLTYDTYAQHLEVGIHDPVMAQQDDMYYLFGTGAGVTVYSSSDMKNWERLDPVFETTPDWIHETIPNFRRSMWAPDIIEYNGTWYLYYSVSAFGRNISAIGVATNTTLDPNASDFEWIDHGKVIRSVPGRDMWNAIDPNIIVDDEGIPWMTFGSFWMGMKLVRLADNMIEIYRDPQEWHTTSARHRYWKLDERDAGNAMNSRVEAPFIFKKNGYYYNFVSWDWCCRGEDATYKVIAGRSKDVRGPYLDKEGQKMTHGGGSFIIGGDGERYAAIGHNSAYTFNGQDYLIAHAYDLSDEGRSKLMILEIEWDENNWPIVTFE